MHGGHTDVPTRRPGEDPRSNLPLSPMSPGDGGVSLSLLVPLMGESSRRSSITGIGHSLAMCFPQRDAAPGEISAVEVGCRKVWGFSNIDFAPGKDGAVELDFRRASFPPGENGAEECDYIRPASLAGPSVCARTVTGSRLFGSPHRLVRSCLCSAVLSLRWIDGRVISKGSTDIPQSHHLEMIVGRSTPDIYSSVWTVSVGIYLLKIQFCKDSDNLLLLLQNL